MAINSGNFLYFLPSYLIDKSDFSDSIKLKFLQILLSEYEASASGSGA